MAQKRILDLTVRSDFDATCKLPVDDASQTWYVTGLQIFNYILAAGNVVTSMLASAAVTVIKLASSATPGPGVLNYSLSASVGSSNLTIALKDQAGSDASATSPIYALFRSSTAATGTQVRRAVTAALSTVISSGSIPGPAHASGKTGYLFIYLIDNAGTVELAWSSQGNFDEGTLYNTTAEGGAGGADLDGVLYSTTARTGVAVRLIGRMKSTQTTGGTWAAVPTEISLLPFRNLKRASLLFYGGNGHGSTNTKIRKHTTMVTTGDPSGVMTGAQSNTLGSSVTFNVAGPYMAVITDLVNSGSAKIGLSLSSTELTTDIASITPPDRLCYAATVSGSQGSVCAPFWAEIGDVLRVHTDGTPDNTSNSVMWRVVACF